jgi:transposase
VHDAALATTPTLEELAAKVASIEAERDEYKRAYVVLLEAYRKLEAGLAGQKRERFTPANQEQLTLSLLSMLVPSLQAETAPLQSVSQVPAHERKKPTGRKPLPENLPVIEVEALPLEVQRAGLDAFERIGEDVTETVERRPASFVNVKTIRGKYVPRGQPREGADVDPVGKMPAVLQAPAPELPIPRGLAGPGLLADTIVRRFQDHLPLHRLERIYGREGLPLARSTICGWHGELASLMAPLIAAMWNDAMSAPYLCTDATGVLVQDLEKCRRAHFFVVIAPEKHVLYRFTPKHDSAAVDAMLGEYRGHLVADAHSVYDHLYRKGHVVEVACWAHARRYFFKALETDGARARHALSLIQALFRLEREYATSPPAEKLRLRAVKARPIVEAFFAWCDVESMKVLDETPISKAIGYARNQRDALMRFLDDGQLPIHNNGSENALRREALGRKNWLFVGNDEGGEVNATLVTLLASAQMHGLEPLGYVRDLLCLLPGWPVKRALELAPAYWRTTVGEPGVAQQLAENVFRRASLGELPAKPPATT